jgi:hypothetical protein
MEVRLVVFHLYHILFQVNSGSHTIIQDANG